jgi:cytochrome c biogenesis protein CcmG/thiol:disulfide interchange protein DsbE
MNRLVTLLATALEPGERDAVLGDLAESGATGPQTLRDVLGLVVRRQAALWRNWRPWMILLVLAVPAAAMLSLYCHLLAYGSSVPLWFCLENWDPAYLQPPLRADLLGAIGQDLRALVTLGCWSWIAGLTLGLVARRTIRVTGFLFCVVLALGTLWENPRLFQPLYDVLVPILLQAIVVLLPALAGIRRGLRLTHPPRIFKATLWVAAIAALLIVPRMWFWGLFWGRFRFPIAPPVWILQNSVYLPIACLLVATVRRRWRVRAATAAVLFVVLAGISQAADLAPGHAALQPPVDRKPAPAFQLEDSAGKTVTLKQLRGKIVLLDFWATWCHGCKEEIPWFSEFARRYTARGLAVVGVSLDDGGWTVVKPFLATAGIPYRILLGDDPTAQKYGIGSLPDTFLIDRQGKIAASYTGMVDKDDVERNLQALLGSTSPRP